MGKNYRVLVIDDASFMLKAVSDMLNSDPEITVVGTAKNGLEGLKKIKALRPDVITLDIDMPVMDGIRAIRHIMIESPVPVVVLSSLFADGSITFEALRLGVIDFVPKPSGAISQDIHTAKKKIIDRIKMAVSVNLDNIRRVKISNRDLKEGLSERYGFQHLDYIIALGTTLTGPNTAIRLFANLPSSLPATAVFVKEISPKILPAFVKKFDEYVPWRIDMARDGMALEQGTCYIGSNEYCHSIQANQDGAPCLKVDDRMDNPLDLLFSSAAQVFKQNTIGVLLTGIGDDGAEGFADIRGKSGTTIAQSTDSCVFPNLTHNVIAQGLADSVVDEAMLYKKIISIME